MIENTGPNGWPVVERSALDERAWWEDVNTAVQSETIVIGPEHTGQHRRGIRAWFKRRIGRPEHEPPMWWTLSVITVSTLLVGLVSWLVILGVVPLQP